MALRKNRSFLAIDFETANYYRDSACAVGLAKIENNQIVESASYLIRPPSNWFVFTYIHGLTWEDVKNEPTFRELWPKIRPMFKGVDFLVAHNSGFDRGVLKACCKTYNVDYPEIPFQCTMHLCRKLWNIHPTKLNIVCEHFGIPLNHHEALSDTLACAEIMMRAVKDNRFIFK